MLNYYLPFTNNFDNQSSRKASYICKGCSTTTYNQQTETGP